MYRRLLALLALAVAALGPTRAAHAQFSRNPNGQVFYQTDLTTTGGFVCFPFAYTSGSCTADGNSILLTNGGESLRLAFTGVSRPLVASNIRSDAFDFGTIISTFEGTGPFLFPTIGAVDPIFTLAVQFASTNATLTTAVYEFYNVGNNTQLTAPCCLLASDLVAWIPSQPQPFAYGAMIYDNLSPITVSGRRNAVTLQAQVGIVPEPASLVLFGTGLIGIGGVVRRRRVVG